MSKILPRTPSFNALSSIALRCTALSGTILSGTILSGTISVELLVLGSHKLRVITLDRLSLKRCLEST